MKQKTTRIAMTGIATVVITMLAMSTTGLVTPVHAALTKCTTSSSSFPVCTVHGSTPGVCFGSVSACNPTTGGIPTTHKEAAGIQSGMNQACHQGVETGCTTTKFSSVH